MVCRLVTRSTGISGYVLPVRNSISVSKAFKHNSLVFVWSGHCKDFRNLKTPPPQFCSGRYSLIY